VRRACLRSIHPARPFAGQVVLFRFLQEAKIVKEFVPK
jgi:hypothetical protein